MTNARTALLAQRLCVCVCDISLFVFHFTASLSFLATLSFAMAHKKLSIIADDAKSRVMLASKDLDIRMTRIHEHALDGQVGTTLYRFGGETTAHGIPRIFSAITWRGRVFWLLLTVLCGLAFLFQYSLVQEKYSRKEKIVNVEVGSCHQFLWQSRECPR